MEFVFFYIAVAAAAIEAVLVTILLVLFVCRRIDEVQELLENSQC